MTDWLRLLGTSLLCGACVVGGMVLSRRVAAALLLTAVGALALAVGAVAAIARDYATPEAVVAAGFFVLAGITTGYMVAAAALPWLAMRRDVLLPASTTGTGTDAVVLLACTDADRYDPRAVAIQGNDLAGSGAIDVPLAATPLVYLAEKTRYRSLGGRSPGPVLARELHEKVEQSLACRGVDDVRLAWSHCRPTLTETIANAIGDGAGRIAVIVLGSEDSDAVDRAKSDFDRACAKRQTVSVAFGRSLWEDRDMPDRLVERIVATAGDAGLAEIGVVLVCPGHPESPGHTHPIAAAEENYFNQRVRMLLVDRGADERLIRIAWLEWQLPDVTEATRHLAALGCSHIVVAPSTFALPALSTALDLRHSVELARLPEGIQASIVTPWGDDDALVAAIVRSASEALQTLSPQSGP